MTYGEETCTLTSQVKKKLANKGGNNSNKYVKDDRDRKENTWVR